MTPPGPGAPCPDDAEKTRAEEPSTPPGPDVDLDPIGAVFMDPERYLRRREGGLAALGKRFGKRIGERRALRRALDACGPLETVLDCPCGMGRLFPFWAARGLSVTGVDRSPAMVEAARAKLRALGAEPEVTHGRVTDLDDAFDRQFDLVTSIRFVYYFDAQARPEILRLLARRSRRWVLVQYKSSETRKGRHNRRRGRNQGKHPLSRSEIRAELAEAGLRLVALESHGPLSDRVLALAQVDEIR